MANGASTQIGEGSLLSDIVAKIKKRECVLFLGAAIHAAPPDAKPDAWPGDQWPPPPWPPDQRPPFGSELSTRLATRSRYAMRHSDADVRDLKRVSLDYEIERQRSGLVQAVRDEVQTHKTGSPLLRMLARIDFPVIVTTNYDTHFENALAAAGRNPFVIPYKNNLEVDDTTDDYPFLNPLPNQPLVLKIHGDILRTPNSMVITEEDYIQFVLRMSDKPPYHPVPELVKSYLTKGTTLFLGYGLSDYNLRLLFKTLRWKMNITSSTYSVDLKPDPFVREVLERRTGQVSYIVQNVWEFVPALVEAAG